jgi:hypothetical protein
VPDDIDPLRIDAIRRFDVADQTLEVAGVVDAAAVDVTAGLGRVPELITGRILRPVGVDI